MEKLRTPKSSTSTWTRWKNGCTHQSRCQSPFYPDERSMFEDARQKMLGSPKRTRRSRPSGVSLVLFALLLLCFMLQPLLVPRAKFFRVPSKSRQAKELTGHELTTEPVLAQHVFRQQVAVQENTPDIKDDPAEKQATIQHDTAVDDTIVEEEGVVTVPAADHSPDKRAEDEQVAATEDTQQKGEPEDMTAQETNTQDDTPEQNEPSDGDIQIPPATSVLHPKTPDLPPLNSDVVFTAEMANTKWFTEYFETFPQHGKDEPGQHYRIENNNPLSSPGTRERDSVLLITVFNDVLSWSNGRNITDFFELVGSFDYPKEKLSIALLTSSVDEYRKAQLAFRQYISLYPRLSIIFRDDFAQESLTRENRHDDWLQGIRRRMIARYRNFALMSTLETWHQHVLWLDADIDVIPSGLLLKMTQSGLDVVEPMCVRKFSNENDDWDDYDLNAWVGQRKVRPDNYEGNFVPGNLNVKNLHDLRDEGKMFVPLDSVGGSMLYVRADVHRQGVLFPSHYVIGSEWDTEGYDGIETEGLCYSAHFLGFKCWGMPNDIIFHAT